MTPAGKIIEHRFARTIINSCTQLAYEHAQKIIDSPDQEFSHEDFPKVHGTHSVSDLVRTVKSLQAIAVNLRSSRFEGGALRIDQPKLMFSLNPNTCLPETFNIYINQDCHRLIEEFMLLANITVATRLQKDFPQLAFLRSHPEPIQHLMESLQTKLETVGIHLDTQSAGGLQKSMRKYDGADLMSEARMVVINALCAKPMARAKYFCAGSVDDMADYWHYALNVPLYTHFTSPIRRYADIMVHRLLSASLEYSSTPEWDMMDVVGVAANCNKQKYNAKKAGEQSSDLFLTKYIELHQPIREKAVILDVKDRSVDITILSMGNNVRLYNNNFSPAKIIKEDRRVIPNSISLLWPSIKVNELKTIPPYVQVIEIFAIVDVHLTVSKSRKIEAKLLRPRNE